MGNAEERPITNSKNGGFGTYQVPFFYLKSFFRLVITLIKHIKKAQDSVKSQA